MGWHQSINTLNFSLKNSFFCLVFLWLILILMFYTYYALTVNKATWYFLLLNTVHDNYIFCLVDIESQSLLTSWSSYLECLRDQDLDCSCILYNLSYQSKNDTVLAQWVECSPMIRVDLGSIPGRIIPMIFKMVLDTSLLNTQQYKVHMRVKWSNPGKGVVPSPIHCCSSYWKGSLLVALDYGRQLYLLTIVVEWAMILIT